MKQKTPKYQGFGVEKTPRQKYQDRLDRISQARFDKKHGQINMQEWLADQDRRDAMKANPRATPARVTTVPRAAPRRRHAAGVRSSAASGDSGDGNSEPEPDRPFLTQASLAALLCISKKTLQNLYSRTPHSLPVAIQIPGTRGPRWTPQAVQEWLDSRPQHTPKPIPVAPKKKAGRPRIAQAVKGGAA